MKLHDDFKDALDNSIRNVLDLEEFIHRGTSRLIQKNSFYEDGQRAFDDMIKATLDLLGALIIAKADAEVYRRFKS
jgi:hypothetical protein